MKNCFFVKLRSVVAVTVVSVSLCFLFYSVILHAQEPTPTTETSEESSLAICSFNIQFLGHFIKRDNAALAMILRDFDIVVVQELVAAIADWIDDHDDVEKDFIILGDMNIEDFNELNDTTPSGFKSLNDECEATNTNVNGPKPYDHVMFNPQFTKEEEIDKKFDFRVYNLIEAMRPFWNSPDPYPGGSVNPIGLPAYDHNTFRSFYSDHHPVVFQMIIPEADDD